MTKKPAIRQYYIWSSKIKIKVFYFFKFQLCLNILSLFFQDCKIFVKANCQIYYFKLKELLLKLTVSDFHSKLTFFSALRTLRHKNRKTSLLVLDKTLIQVVCDLITERFFVHQVLGPNILTVFLSFNNFV